MAYKFIYIDDDDESRSRPIADILEKDSYLNIEIIKPAPFEIILKDLKKKDFDGIILDLRLDENFVPENNTKVFYNAASLAQEMRSQITLKKWDFDFPIILCSTDKKIKNFFDKDYSSHDIFDFSFEKDKINKNPRLPLIISSFVECYKNIYKYNANFENILSIKNLEILDIKLISRLNEIIKFPVHTISKFLFNKLINITGPLIDENLLAARLGIDIETSKDWELLKENHLYTAKYKGVFSSAFHRWWMNSISGWWNKKITKEFTLAMLDGKQRAELIKKATKLKKLNHAVPIEKCISTRYWSICQGLKKPLDPLEGLRISEEDLASWQESNYVSFYAAVERININDWKDISPIDKKRFTELKKSFK